jgi:hypothetical protein
VGELVEPEQAHDQGTTTGGEVAGGPLPGVHPPPFTTTALPARYVSRRMRRLLHHFDEARRHAVEQAVQ